MGRKREQTHSLRGWFRRMFRQPPGDFYGRASVYLSGRRMEIEQFRRIRSYEEGKLCLELGCGTLTVYGDDLKIETLSARRLTLRGRFCGPIFQRNRSFLPWNGLSSGQASPLRHRTAMPKVC